MGRRSLPRWTEKGAETQTRFDEQRYPQLNYPYRSFVKRRLASTVYNRITEPADQIWLASNWLI